MVAYGIGVLQLIKHLKVVNPDTTQPWYDNNARALVMFDNLERYFNLLNHIVSDWMYYPSPIKIIMIVHPNNLEAGEMFGEHHGFTVCASACYLSGYIRYGKSKGAWIKIRWINWR